MIDIFLERTRTWNVIKMWQLFQLLWGPRWMDRCGLHMRH